MKLAIITLNYNGSETTLKLLKSLRNQPDKDTQIIAVDNASEEGDFNILKQGLVGEILIRNDQNLGFAGGNNVAIKMALQNGADWLLLLNNDTWVEEGFIISLRAKLEPLEGIAGIPLVEGTEVAYSGKIKWLRPTLKHSHLPDLKPALTYIIGGGLAIHKDVFSKTGFLDEKYFLYFEDADFSMKVKRAGFKMTILYGPKANHWPSTTTKKMGAPLLLRYHYRNAFYFNLKNGPWYIKIAVWPWSFWIMKKELFKIMFQIRPVESWAIFMGVIDFYKGRMGKIN